MKIRSIIGAAYAAVAIATAAPAAAHGVGEKVTPHFEQAIPNIPGKSLIALVVDYPPGGASPSHIHAKSAFIFAYVVSGEIESKVNDGPKRVYRAGESLYEPPGSPPSRQPQCEQDQAGKAARGLRRRYRRQGTDHPRQIIRPSRRKKMSKRLDYNQIAPAGVKALGGVYGYVMQSGLPAVLVDLVYLRISQINNCAYCLDMHTRDLSRKDRRSRSSRWCRRGRKPAISSTSVSVPRLPGPKR